MDIKLIISIYAAIVSTIVFFWRVYEFYDNRKGKLKVGLNIGSEVLYQGSTKATDWQQYLYANIVNVSTHKRQIKRPAIEADREVNGRKISIIVSAEVTTNFPLPLEPGDIHSYKMPMDAIEKEYIKNGVKKLRAVVTDTHGRSYKSNWLELPES